MSATFWRMNATANVATSITAGECDRSGRKTSLSITTESASTTPMQKRIDSQFGSPHCAPKASAKAPTIISCP